MTVLIINEADGYMMPISIKEFAKKTAQNNKEINNQKAGEEGSLR